MISPEDHALLSNLVYNEDFHETLEGWISEGNLRSKTLGAYIDDRLSDKGTKLSNGGNSYTTQAEWDAVVKKAQRGPLAKMRVVDVTQNEHDKGYMLTLADDENKEAVIVYQGTCSAEGWREDVVAGGVELTESQGRAIKYANEMSGRLVGYRITATGHSKGGNEAALVAIACDGVSESYAFDAPGFSDMFYDSETYAPRVSERSGRVHCYSYEQDYVSSLLTPLPGADAHLLASDLDVWEGTDGPGGMLRLSLRAHSPVMLFNSDCLHGDGSFSEAVGEGASYRGEILKFSQFATGVLPENDTRLLMNFLATFVAGTVGAEDVDGDQRPDVDVPGLLGNALSHPYEMGLLLAVLGEYPDKEELVTSIVNVGALPPGAWEAIAVALKRSDFASFVSRLVVAFRGVWSAGLLMMLVSPYLAAVRRSRERARAAIRCRVARLRAEAAMRGHVAALASLKDFSHARLERIESLCATLLRIPPLDLGAWNRAFGHERYFHRVGVAGEPASVSALFQGADADARASARRVREVFERAWRLDEACARECEDAIRSLSKATAALAALGA